MRIEYKVITIGYWNFMVVHSDVYLHIGFDWILFEFFLVDVVWKSNDEVIFLRRELNQEHVKNK